MSETITLIPLHQLRESPTNPRKRYSDASLQELADSISTQGVMSPIVVRELAQADLEFTHEMVFGHRRSRAARLAGLAEIPAIVRDMSDEEATLAQIHENLHRDDVHPVEEAEAFAALLERHNVTVERLVLDSGKSRSYIYGRLKLAGMAPEVRDACTDEGLGAEIALLVARLPHHKLQVQALRSLRVSSEWVSYRTAKNLLANHIVRISDAPFDLADASMPGGACARCPKLACNDPDLHELSADACIDRACHDAKLAAHARRVVELAREMGAGPRSLIRPACIVIPGHEGEPVKALRDADAQYVLMALGQDDEPAAPSTAARGQDDDNDGEPELSPAAQVVRNAAGWEKVLREVVAVVRARPRSAGDLHMLLQRELSMSDDFGLAGQVFGLDGEFRAASAADDWWSARVDAMDADTAASLLVAIGLVDTLGAGSWMTRASAERKAAMVTAMGIDILAIAGQPAPVAAARIGVASTADLFEATS